MRKRVFLADDHAIVRFGLQQIVDEQPDMVVVGQASSGAEVLRAPNKHEWDLLVLDLSMPEGSGLDVLRAVRAEQPRLPVVILSMHPEEQYAAQAVSAGAAAFASKSLGPEALLALLRKVLAGGVVAPSVAQVSGRVLSSSDRPLHAALSPREYQVFSRIYRGLTPHEVAQELDLAASTVSNHLARIKEKLRVQTVGEIVAYAHRQGLVD